MPPPSDMRFAVIPSDLTRLSLTAAVGAIKDQVDELILVDSSTETYETALALTLGKVEHLIAYPDPHPFNIAKAWNLGLQTAATRATEAGIKEWWVAVINDDATPPPQWMDAVIGGMKLSGADAGCSGSLTGHVLHHTRDTPKPYNVFDRMTGWAYVLRGSADLWLDEDLVYWFGDDDLMYRAANRGGHIRIPGYPVPNLHENGHMTPERHVQSGVDRGTFVAKNGFQPW